MAYTVPGPTISGDNIVLRSAVLVSESERSRDTSNSVKVEVLVRNRVAGLARLSSIGSWNQQANKLDAGKNRELLSGGRKGMRLRDGQQVVAASQPTARPRRRRTWRSRSSLKRSGA